MAERSSSRKSAPRNLKLLLIPVLGAVLLYVVCSPSNAVTPPPPLVRASGPQPQTSSAPAAVSTATATRRAASLATAKLATEASQKPAVGSTPGSAVTWPATPLTDVLAVNPFKMPTELKPVVAVAEVPPQPLRQDLKEPDSTKTAELRAAVKGQRLTALLHTSKGVGAIVGDNVVGVGDLVGERLRVTAIHSTGVELELIDKPAPAEGQKPE